MSASAINKGQKPTLDHLNGVQVVGGSNQPIPTSHLASNSTSFAD